MARPMEEIKKGIPSLADLDKSDNESIAEMRRLLDKVRNC